MCLPSQVCYVTSHREFASREVEAKNFVPASIGTRDVGSQWCDDYRHAEAAMAKLAVRWRLKEARKMTTRAAMGRRLTLLLAGVLVAAAMASAAAPHAREATGAEYRAQVVGGIGVPNGKYPFVAALLDVRNGNTPFQQQICGGTLIDEDSVLTAAHCVYGRSAAPLRVTIGRTVLSSSQGKKRSVSRIFVHRQYDPNLDDAYDAAVLKLSSPVRGVVPISLATARQNRLEKPGRNATVTGWGVTTRQSPDYHEPDTYANRMREVQVPIVSDTRAKSVYGSSYFPRLMVAAGKAGRDACLGDSGGPIFAKVSGEYIQTGVTSWATGCGTSRYPGVYAEVNTSSIRNFIINAVRR
jgi:secreted trypsin-like serine protease